mmetsp:Transcript_48832/g.140382  ORF Transcript_48832/g.140382 Transcript_48832/m.140382 type:complete len:210 (-) Transcript_48832:637-1266(-)
MVLGGHGGVERVRLRRRGGGLVLPALRQLARHKLAARWVPGQVAAAASQGRGEDVQRRRGLRTHLGPRAHGPASRRYERGDDEAAIHAGLRVGTALSREDRHHLAGVVGLPLGDDPGGHQWHGHEAPQLLLCRGSAPGQRGRSRGVRGAAGASAGITQGGCCPRTDPASGRRAVARWPEELRPHPPRGFERLGAEWRRVADVAGRRGDA